MAPAPDPRAAHLYCPFYCEENVWQLARARGPADHRVLLISNAARQVPLWAQRAAPAPGLPVLWDYHVVLVHLSGDGARVLDLDSTLPLDLPLGDYLATTFAAPGELPVALAPRFRVLDAEAYCARLWSDRAHMRAADGSWLQPAPPWPPPLPAREPWPLPALWDLDRPDPGVVTALAGLPACLAPAS